MLTFDSTTKPYLEFRFGMQVAVYILAKSFLERKAFAPGHVLSGDDYRAWNQIISGEMICILDVQPYGMEVQTLGEKTDFLIQTVAMRSYDAGLIVRDFSLSKGEGKGELRASIDRYFADLATSGLQSARNEESETGG